jgi:hypothetical protein
MDESTLSEGVPPASSRQDISEEGVPPGRGKGLRVRRTGKAPPEPEQRRTTGLRVRRTGKAPLLPGMSPETPREPEPEPASEHVTESEPAKSHKLGDFTPHKGRGGPPTKPATETEDERIMPTADEIERAKRQRKYTRLLGPAGRGRLPPKAGAKRKRTRTLKRKRPVTRKRKREPTRTRKPSSKRKRTGKR